VNRRGWAILLVSALLCVGLLYLRFESTQSAEQERAANDLNPAIADTPGSGAPGSRSEGEPLDEGLENEASEPILAEAMAGLHPVFEGLPEFAGSPLGELFARVRQGESEAAREAAQGLQECRSLLHNRHVVQILRHGVPHVVELEIDRRQRWLEKRDEETRDREISRLNEGMDQLQRTTLDCLPYWRSDIRALRAELEALAERGNPAARALFALWPPKGEIVWEDRQEIVRWESKALEFSMSNLIEGEPAGLFVFAEAYRYGGYFLPVHPGLANTFDMALVRCGLDPDGERLREHAPPFASVGGRKPLTLTPELIRPLVTWSEELVAFCGTGIWLSRQEVTVLLTEPAPG